VANVIDEARGTTGTCWVTAPKVGQWSRAPRSHWLRRRPRSSGRARSFLARHVARPASAVSGRRRRDTPGWASHSRRIRPTQPTWWTRSPARSSRGRSRSRPVASTAGHGRHASGGTRRGLADQRL